MDTQGKGVWLLWIHRGRGVWLLWLTAAELMKSMWPLESSSFSNACGNIRSFSVGGITGTTKMSSNDKVSLCSYTYLLGAGFN